MRSMTGYGRAQSRDGSEVVVRAVNGRFLELRAHLPKDYLFLESALKEVVQSRCRRGTIDIFLSPSLELETTTLSVNRKLAKQWHGALMEVAKVCGLDPKSISADRVLSSAGVIQMTPDSKGIKKRAEFVLDLARRAADQCAQERKREGAKLKAVMADLLKELESTVAVIESLCKAYPERIRSRTEAKLKRLLDEGPGKALGNSHDRLLQEVALLAERSDVSEELARLRTHINRYKALLKNEVDGLRGSDPEQGVGKRLDFYTQELLREVNTIGSKLSEAQITEEVVNAKSTIEKLREQVQNVE